MPLNGKGKLAVILVNLGTPDQPTSSAIRKYLREFLSDRRVVSLPRILWFPILYGLVLTLRPSKLVDKYKLIWGEKDAPLREITEQLATGVKNHLGSQHVRSDISIYNAMTYGNPSLESVIDEIIDIGTEELIFIPLFPQYSSATTGAVVDRISNVFSKRTYIPSYRIVNHYYSQTKYVHALTKSIEKYSHQLEAGAKLIFSFHGIPLSLYKKGDPYPTQCQKTAEQVAYGLALDEEQWLLSFQSRSGPSTWLQPYTEDMLKDLPRQGVKNVVIICPGFAVDCLETLEEIADRAKNTFLDSGGEKFSYVPALNAGTDHISMISDLVLSHLYSGEIHS